MKSGVGPGTFSMVLFLFTLCAEGLLAWATAETRAADDVKTLEVTKETPREEIRDSQLGYRDTLLFYTFNQQKIVLTLQIGNDDKTFPVKANLHVFADGVTEEDLAKWRNNQHSDGLFADAPSPTATHKIPAAACKVTSHEFTGKSKQPFGEYDNYTVTFQVNDHADPKGVKLKGFTGKATVHVKTK